MQTKLTLKASSMLFFSNVNLLRNVEVEVDTDKLTVSDLKNINRYIKSGSILSTEGVLPEPEEVVEVEVAVEAQAVVEEAPVEVVTEQTETVEEEQDEEITTEEQEQQDEEVQILETKKIIVQQEQPLIICVKSYGDYRYIDSRDILYFEADNNSTDIHLKDGEMVTAFKTLKHFENVLPTNQLLRIHNSYIIGINHVARIHTGNAVCFIKNSTIKLPFSKSYRDNVELIIHRIASGNYLEI